MHVQFCSLSTHRLYAAGQEGYDLVLLYWNTERWVEIDAWYAGLISIDEFITFQLGEGI